VKQAQDESLREYSGRSLSLGVGIVGQMLDRLRGSPCTEILLDGFEHHVMHAGTRNARIGDSRQRDDIAIKSVDDEDETDDLTVTAGEVSTNSQLIYVLPRKSLDKKSQ
jgi:hypothetical protein